MMDNKECGISGMMKCWKPVLVVFAVIFAFQWVFHGMFMMPQYEATAGLWRPKGDMQNFMWVCIVSKLVMAGVITCLYGWLCKCNNGAVDQKLSIKFGVKIGLLLGISHWASYAYMPIPMEMALWWLIGDVAMGIIVGLVLGKLSSMCKKGA